MDPIVQVPSHCRKTKLLFLSSSSSFLFFLCEALIYCPFTWLWRYLSCRTLLVPTTYNKFTLSQDPKTTFSRDLLTRGKWPRGFFLRNSKGGHTLCTATRYTYCRPYTQVYLCIPCTRLAGGSDQQRKRNQIPFRFHILGNGSLSFRFRFHQETKRIRNETERYLLFFNLLLLTPYICHTPVLLSSWSSSSKTQRLYIFCGVLYNLI